ncbi:YhcH/YjgK/YiaL family protein [Prolixibacteraceae bacterium Z1-6]|uniref:YhcH/YjgK/YiaL family protein n=1 Tax=Draconibacterium aestuarii TaxID=2998507 RepID=A0A9X3F7E0_9BACT|nr:YhcH/YjgK/YiaL family protein [Prolixibacteraceae bacterium Z1-6]
MKNLTNSINSGNPEKWTDDEINNWFENGQWLEGWTAKPDFSINRRTFAVSYHKNPGPWKQAFSFMQQTDLKNLEPGKIEIDGKNLFVGIDEYQSKDKNQTKYESHKKYIDIQYIISGEEQIGLCKPDKAETSEPYNAEKDLEFYNYDDGDYIKVTPANFVIFFPDDLHQPCIKLNDSVWVKKAVIKIRINS